MSSPADIISDLQTLAMLEKAINSDHFTTEGKILACEVICDCHRKQGWIVDNPAWDGAFLNVMAMHGYLEIHQNGGVTLSRPEPD